MIFFIIKIKKVIETKDANVAKRYDDAIKALNAKIALIIATIKHIF
jgi:hypothetical protein